MSVWKEWVHHPEKLWFRKALFQVHLLLGTGAGIYVVMMSLTGSLLVYRNSLESIPSLVPPVEWIVNLHENLLFGMSGRFVNGIGATCVILLCLTGAVIWWPGIADWHRALTVNWKALLARFTWDLHSAIGFWTLLFLLIWGFSGLYFAFPGAVIGFFGFIDPRDRFTDQAVDWMVQLHFGRFNWFSEVIWSLVGLVPALLTITGVFLCCRRMIYKEPTGRPHSHSVLNLQNSSLNTEESGSTHGD
jgi:uncharacterized iron-regulated membrane protein